MTRPKRITFGVVLFAFVILAIFGGYGVLQSRDKAQKIAGCKRTNELREESNSRAPIHQTDQDNLLKLLHAITATRKLEAKTFRQSIKISRQSLPQYAASPALAPFLPQIKKGIRLQVQLAERYEAAQKLDDEIAESEAKLKFDTVRIIDCEALYNDRPQPTPGPSGPTGPLNLKGVPQ